MRHYRHWIPATAPDHGENQRENDNGHSHEENDHAWVDIAFALRTAREGAEDGCHNHQEGLHERGGKKTTVTKKTSTDSVNATAERILRGQA